MLTRIIDWFTALWMPTIGIQWPKQQMKCPTAKNGLCEANECSHKPTPHPENPGCHQQLTDCRHGTRHCLPTIDKQPQTTQTNI